RHHRALRLRPGERHPRPRWPAGGGHRRGDGNHRSLDLRARPRHGRPDLAARGRAQRLMRQPGRRLLHAGAVAVTVLALAGCAYLPEHGPFFAPRPPPRETTWAVPPGPGPGLTPVRFDQMVGWATDRESEALAAFLAGCAELDAKPDQSLGGQGEAAERLIR